MRLNSLSSGLIGHWMLDAKHGAKDLSGYCIHPETRCFFGAGFKMAKDAVEGDTLYQDNGKFSTIKNIIPSQYSGELIKIKARAVPAIKLTPSHRVLVVDKDVVYKYRKNKWRDKTPFNFTPRWVEAGKLQEGDYFIVPKPYFKEEDISFDIITLTARQNIINDLLDGVTLGEIEKKYQDVKKTSILRYKYITQQYTDPIGENVLFDAELAELFGWYLAEGSTNHSKGSGSYDIVFSLSSKEEKEVERLQYLLKEKLGLSSLKYIRGTSCIVRARSRQFKIFLDKNFGRGAKNKYIPDWLLNAKKELVRAFLLAYNKGDGCVTETRRDRDYPMVCFETSSPQLVTGITLLLMKLDVCPNIFEMNHPRQMEIRKGEMINQDYGWDIRVTSLDMLKLYPDIRTSKRNVQPYFQDDQNFYIRVSKVEREPYEGIVYDFETETHTIGMPFIIHNSNHGTAAQGGLTVGGATDRHGQAGGATQVSADSSKKIIVPNNSALSPSQISISLWLKAVAFAPYRPFVFKGTVKTHPFTDGYGILGLDEGNAITFYVNHSDNYCVWKALTVGDWHHVVGTYDGSYLRLYVDTVAATPVAYSGAINHAGDLILGSVNASATTEGTFQDVRIYNRALSQTEITMLYDSYKPRTVLQSINESGLLLYLDAGNKSSYPGTGATWKDLSGNGYNATLANTTFSAANGGSLVFNGSNAYGQTINTPFTAGTPFTAIVWAKSSVLSANSNLFGNKEADSSTVGMAIRWPGSTVFHVLKTDTDLRSINFGVATPFGWTCFAAQRSADGYNKVYLNGAYLTGAPISGVATDRFPYFNIGCATPTAGQYFNGSIAQILVYQRALSQAEITQNYNATKGRFNL